VIKKTLAILATVAICAASATVFLSCSGGKTTHPRMMLIGIDAADWKIIDPLIAQGKLPNFARFRKEGASGPLLSLLPKQKSPVLWTSIATGKLPEKHGVGGFMAEEGKLVTRSQRKVEPIWRILGDHDITVGVVNWMVTWPAEEVNGYMVSDYAQYGTDGWPEEGGNETYPPELVDEIKPLMKLTGEVTDEELSQFFGVKDFRKVMSKKSERYITNIRWIYAADETYGRIATYLYAKHEKPDFFAVYLRGVDSICHTFFGFRDKKSVPKAMLTPENIKLFEDTVDKYYIYTDKWIGKLLELVDEQTTVLLISDHGFQGGLHGGTGQHRIRGVVAAIGPGITPQKIVGPTLLDITPTILAFYSLGLAEDMDGEPIVKLLSKEKLQYALNHIVPTYDKPGTAQELPISSPANEKVKERLRSLGYIE